MSDGPARNGVIDSFRGIAVLGVMAYHYTLRWTPPFYSHTFIDFGVSFDRHFSLGMYGVQLFFVISGVVIAMTVSRSASAADFAMRRFARLYPALFVGSIVTFLVCRLGPAELVTTPLDLLASMTFFPEALGRHYADGVYWTLTVELRFYAWIALSFVVLRERFWIGALVLGLLSAAVGGSQLGRLALFPEYWPFFLLGMAGYYAVMAKMRLPAVCLLVSGLGLLALSHPTPLATTLILLGSTAMTVLIPLTPSIPFLPWIGRISYSLYLVHENIGLTVMSWLIKAGVPPLLALWLAIPVVIGLAWLLFAFVEQKGAKLIMDLYRARRRPPEAPTAAGSSTASI